SLAKSLESILDLERLLAKVSLASAGPRDVAALAKSLAVIPNLKQTLESLIVKSEPRPEGAVQPPASPPPPSPSTTPDTEPRPQGAASPASMGHTRLLDIHARLDEIPDLRDQILSAL